MAHGVALIWCFFPVLDLHPLALIAAAFLWFLKIFFVFYCFFPSYFHLEARLFQISPSDLEAEVS